MAKFEVDGFGNVLTNNYIQTLHFINLYGDYIYGTINDDLKKLSPDPLEQELGGAVYTNWAAEEVLKLGLVTIYHRWEKDLNAFLKDQADKQEITVNFNKKRKSFNVWAKDVLENQFDCVVNIIIWERIDETRQIVNSYKHGDSKSFEMFYNKYPHYFHAKGEVIKEPFDEKFLLGIDNFKILTGSVIKFWETIPHNENWRRILR